MASIGSYTDREFPIGDKERVEKGFEFQSWALTVNIRVFCLCHPIDTIEVVEVVNWAAAHKMRVRVIGQKHNWSPLTIAPQDSHAVNDVVLMHLGRLGANVELTEQDTRANGRPTVSVNLGVSQNDFLKLLEKLPNEATRSAKGAPGFGITHCPAPDSITVGGMIAINGHGTAVPNDFDKEVLGDKVTYGSYSNRVLALDAVVYEPSKEHPTVPMEGRYIIKTYTRDDEKDREAIAPFLTHCGRTIVTRATLQVEPNYYMRCRSFMGIDRKTMFAKPDENGRGQPMSMAWFVERHGRAEAIWYPFTPCPWLKVWTVTGPNCPANSRDVTKDLPEGRDACCNYPFSDELGETYTTLLKALTRSWGSATTPVRVPETVLFQAPPDNAETDEQILRPIDEQLAALKAELAQTEEGRALLEQADAHPELKLLEQRLAEAIARHDKEQAEAYEKEEGIPLSGAKHLGGFFHNILSGLKGIVNGFQWTELLTQSIYNTTLDGLANGTKSNGWKQSYDIWGPSRTTLIYVRDTTIRVTANGYAILCKPSHVATVMHEFTTKFEAMLMDYKSRGEFPIAMPLEIRVTGVDDPALVGDGKGQSPWLSGLNLTEEDQAKGFTHCLWLDVLSLPGNPWANKFYHEMEQWMLDHKDFNGDDARMRPEWSKGWGYDDQKGPWLGERMVDHTRAMAPKFNAALEKLEEADPCRVYTNPWLSFFFQKVDEEGAPLEGAAAVPPPPPAAARPAQFS